MPTFEFVGFGGEGLSFGFSLGINRCDCPIFESEQQFQWVNNWTKSVGNHLYKWGADVRYAQNLRVATSFARSGDLAFIPPLTAGPNGGGLGLASFLLGDVSFFNRIVNRVFDAGERQNRWFFYGQDTYRVTPKLTLNYGLRWEIYFPQSVTGKGKGGWVDLDTGLVNVAGYGRVNLQGNVKNTLDNFAPRLGVAYQATPRTVTRMGYGRSFDLGVFGSVFGHTATQNLPVLVTQGLIGPSPTIPAFTLAQGPPPVGTCSGNVTSGCFPVVPPSGQFPLPDGVLPQVVPSRLRLPTIDAWNLAVQHAITPSMSASVVYVGNKGTHVFPGSNPNYDVNQQTIVGYPNVSVFERKLFFRKFGWTQPINYWGSDASSNYNALEAVFEKRFTRGYTLLAHYTWAKGLGYDSNYYAIDPKLNYGVNDFDRKHAFVLTNVVELPFGEGKRFFTSHGGVIDRLLGGWSLSGTTLWDSGLPFAPSYSSCFSDRDTGSCRPNVVGPVKIHPGNRTTYFTTTGGIPLSPFGQPGDTIGPWQRPAPGIFGNLRRNSLRGPGFFQTDISVAKSFKLDASVSLQFRTDIYNVFNVVNLDIPQSAVGAQPCVDCPFGAAITNTAFMGTALQRQLMFSVRISF
jgi:TonB dependent receptor